MTSAAGEFEGSVSSAQTSSTTKLGRETSRNAARIPVGSPPSGTMSTMSPGASRSSAAPSMPECPTGFAVMAGPKAVMIFSARSVYTVFPVQEASETRFDTITALALGVASSMALSGRTMMSFVSSAAR